MPKSSRKSSRDASQFTRGRAEDEAKTRWFSVIELERILDSSKPLLPITNHPPKQPPNSGSVFIYDRSITRNYKDDGHVWIKKRNSLKVREDHVKLRLDGKHRVYGCYVHSEFKDTFHRRTYHLLDPDIEDCRSVSSSPTPSFTDSEILSNARKRMKGMSSLVLVHYLDTKEGSELLLKMNFNYPIPKRLKFDSVLESDTTINMGPDSMEAYESIPDNGDIENHDPSDPMIPYSSIQFNQSFYPLFEAPGEYKITHVKPENSSFLEDLRFSINQSSEGSFNEMPYHPDHFDCSLLDFNHDTLESREIQKSTSYDKMEFYNLSGLQYVMSSGNSFISHSGSEVDTPLEVLQDEPNLYLHQRRFDGAHKQNQDDEDQMSLPKVIDVTPNQIIYRHCPGDPTIQNAPKIVVSLGEPIPLHHTNSTGTSVGTNGEIYHYFIAFCDILFSEKLYISSATEINPYTFKCIAPTSNLVNDIGSYTVCILGVQPSTLATKVTDVQRYLQEEWERIAKPMTKCDSTQILPLLFAWREATNISFLSQMSDDINSMIEFSTITSYVQSDEHFGSTGITNTKDNDIIADAPLSY